MRVSLTPSATPLLTRDIVVRLKEAGLTRLAVSMDGASAATHDAFLGLSGSFARTLDAVRWANEVELPVQINTTFSRRNLAEIDASLRTKILQPTARRVGITKQIGWHTFRRTYSSLLASTGNDVKVVQELMRHSKISTTMEVYAQAGMEQKRVAQRKAVDLLLGRKPRNASNESAKMECSHTVPTRGVQFPEVVA